MRFVLCILLMMVSVAVGGAFGFLPTLVQPTSYRCTTQLMVETTGDAVEPAMLPTFESLSAICNSDRMTATVFAHPSLRGFSEQMGDQEQFADLMADSFVVESDTQAGPSATQILRLQIDSSDSKFAEATVRAYVDSFVDFMNQRQSNPHHDLLVMLSTITEQLHPKLISLENRYRDFRSDALLERNDKGELINPHRVRVLELIKRRNLQTEELQRKRILQQQIANLPKQFDDPAESLAVAMQLFAPDINIPEGTQASTEAAKTLDFLVKSTEVEVDFLTKQISEIDSQIAEKQKSSAKLSNDEAEDNAMKRQITRTTSLLEKVEDQISRVSLAGSVATTQVTSLTEPSEPYLVRPVSTRLVLVGATAGFIFGLFLAALMFAYWPRPESEDAFQ